MLRPKLLAICGRGWKATKFQRFSEVFRGFQRFSEVFQRPSQRPSQSAIFLSELRVVLPLIVLPLKTPTMVKFGGKTFPPANKQSLDGRIRANRFADSPNRLILANRFRVPEPKCTVSQRWFAVEVCDLFTRSNCTQRFLLGNRLRFLCGNDTVAVAMHFAMKTGKMCFSLRKFLAISPAIQKNR